MPRSQQLRQLLVFFFLRFPARASTTRNQEKPNEIFPGPTTQLKREAIHSINYNDIIFILDSSASISPAHFNPSLITARNLVTRFAPDTQFAVVTFGTNATVNFKFNSSKVRNLFPAFSLPSDKNSNSCTCAEGFQMLFNRCILLASAHLAPAYPPLKTSL